MDHCLFIHSSVDGLLGVSTFWVLWTMLPWTFVYTFLYGPLFSEFLSVFPTLIFLPTLVKVLVHVMCIFCFTFMINVYSSHASALLIMYVVLCYNSYSISSLSTVFGSTYVGPGMGCYHIHSHRNEYFTAPTSLTPPTNPLWTSWYTSPPRPGENV